MLTVRCVPCPLYARYVSLEYELYWNVQVAMVISPIVFPLAFSINESYRRREKVLDDFSMFFGSASELYVSASAPLATPVSVRRSTAHASASAPANYDTRLCPCAASRARVALLCVISVEPTVPAKRRMRCGQSPARPVGLLQRCNTRPGRARPCHVWVCRYWLHRDWSGPGKLPKHHAYDVKRHIELLLKNLIQYTTDSNTSEQRYEA